ncbi:hypothetical protein ALO_14987 [Acetonema longum DSM 6540]|uniref:Peptidase S24/S26A/S26B/S26C domain-containing protein n=1 Tax=Acetonema longum DSM 6540 TaxID=1009370 RepID=F7NLM3_9FIRM|nr:hypothetical protein ALO_14987 [Acetonema longum DSM 6540]
MQNDLAESFMDLPEGFSADFAFRVTGNSMKYVGIQEDDIAFIKRSDDDAIGQVIASSSGR